MLGQFHIPSSAAAQIIKTWTQTHKQQMKHKKEQNSMAECRDLSLSKATLVSQSSRSWLRALAQRVGESLSWTLLYISCAGPPMVQQNSNVYPFYCNMTGDVLSWTQRKGHLANKCRSEWDTGAWNGLLSSTNKRCKECNISPWALSCGSLPHIASVRDTPTPHPPPLFRFL